MASQVLLLVAVVSIFRLGASVDTPAAVPKQVQLKEGSIKFFDILIAYKLYDVLDPGPVEDRRMNPTAIFLHGAKYTSDYWLKMGTLKRVAESGVRAMAIDLPGFGATPPLPYSDNNMRSELLRTVVEAAWPAINSTVILVSPSMSGRYSIPFMDRHGLMVTSYVAVAPIGIQDWGGPWEDTHKRVCALGIYGKDDPLAIDAERLIRLFHFAWKVIIPGAGHRSYEDKPDIFHKVLLTFMRKCRRLPNGLHEVEPELGIELVRTLREAERPVA